MMFNFSVFDHKYLSWANLVQNTTESHCEYGFFWHRILPYLRSPHTMNTGKVFKKYTESVFNRILSEYGRIQGFFAPYSPVFRQNTIDYSFCLFFE